MQESSEGGLDGRDWPGLTGILGGSRVPPGPRKMSRMSGVVAYGSGDIHLQASLY